MRSGPEFDSNWPIDRKAAGSREPAAVDYINERAILLPRISLVWQAAQEERPGTTP